ncbi:MAG TPA: response regulator, partial [Pyrinomonadaceae bacterium]
MLFKFAMGQGNQTKEPNRKETILVVDDDESVRRGLYWTLNSDYRVLEAESREDAVKLLSEQNIDLVLSDLHLPPRLEDISEGLAIIEAAREKNPPAQVVVITASNSKRAALEAVKRGAYGFFEKPLNADEVLHIVNQAVRMRRLEVENARLRDELVGAFGFGRLIGSSAALENTL